MSLASAARREALWLVAIILAFVGFGVFFAQYMLSWDAEWGYVFFGYLTLKGEVRLFQDQMLGVRLPLPYYVMGVSQLLAGPSLLAGRLWSLALGAAMVGLTFALGRSLGGRACGFLGVAFLVTHGLMVGNYAAASFDAFCALLIVAGLLAISAGRPPWGGLLGMAFFSMLSVSRAHLAVMVPAVLIYLLLRARDGRERLGLVAIAALPPIAFFAWSGEHLKILAYVPGLDRLVEPFGYRSLFTLGGQHLIPERHWTEALWWFGRRHFFWIVATAGLAGGWVVSRGAGVRRLTLPPLLLFIGGLALYTLAWQAVILRMYLKSVAAWAIPFAPLWAVVLGYAAAVLLEGGRVPAAVRTGAIALLVVVFALAPTFSRHTAMPLTLPSRATTVGLLEADAAKIRSIAPPGQRVFLVGSPIPAYLAGVSPYVQQIISVWTLVPSDDDYVVSRSGLWGPRQVNEWLSRDAPYALVESELLAYYKRIEAYRGVVGQIESLLERHFTLVGVIGEAPWTASFRIYKRRIPAAGG